MPDSHRHTPRGFWRLTVRGEFAAAHALRCYQGKCENIHGHNFAVEADVQGERLDPSTGMLVDFGDLKKALRRVLEELDHRDLNQTPPFDRINPSSENLAWHIFVRLSQQPEILNEHLTLASVTVAEKGAQSATYMELSA